MATTTLLQPLAGGERIQAMDVLRGFALLGIFLMNIEAMAGPLMEGMSGIDPTLHGADRVADALVYVFVQGKFFTLFSLLFGMGFAVMMERAAAAGRPFAGLYLRRTLGLLAFGVAHALLLWSGDVLVSYALVSLPLLLFFRRTPRSRLPKWGVALYCVPLLAMLVLALLGAAASSTPAGAAEMARVMAAADADTASWIAAQRQAYGEGGFAAATLQRADDTMRMAGFLVFFGWHVLGMFVLGMWFVRSGAIARPAEFARLYARLRWVAWPLGLALTVLSAMVSPQMPHGPAGLRATFAFVLQGLGALLMCLGYVAWVVHLLQGSWGRRLALLAPAGRMALSNYLLQSLVASLVFYAYGLGLFDRMPRAWQVLFVAVVFAGQVAFSRWWLARHAQGPLEAIWRAMTYGAGRRATPAATA